MSSFVTTYVGTTALAGTLAGTIVTGALIGAGMSTAMTLVNGGSILENALKGAVTGGVTAGIGAGIANVAAGLSTGSAVSMTAAEQAAAAQEIMAANNAAGGTMTIVEASQTAADLAAAGYTPAMQMSIMQGQQIAISTGVSPDSALRLASQGYSTSDIQTMINNGSDVATMNSLGNSLPDPSAALNSANTGSQSMLTTEQQQALKQLQSGTGKTPTIAESLGMTNSGLAALGQGAASLYGAKLNADAAKAATAETTRQFDIGQANTKPWLTAGKTALGGELDLLGLPGGNTGGTSNALTALHDTPGYQWQVDQGNQALSASNAARGGMGSGKAAVDAVTYGQNLADTNYTKRLNELSALAGTGQTQANASVTQGQQYAGTIGTGVVNQAAATQSGIQGGANALSGYLNPVPKYAMVNGQYVQVA